MLGRGWKRGSSLRPERILQLWRRIMKRLDLTLLILKMQRKGKITNFEDELNQDITNNLTAMYYTQHCVI